MCLVSKLFEKNRLLQVQTSEVIHKASKPSLGTKNFLQVYRQNCKSTFSAHILIRTEKLFGNLEQLTRYVFSALYQVWWFSAITDQEIIKQKTVECSEMIDNQINRRLFSLDGNLFRSHVFETVPGIQYPNIKPKRLQSRQRTSAGDLTSGHGMS